MVCSSRVIVDHVIWNPGRRFSEVQDWLQVFEVCVHVVMQRTLSRG